MFLVIWNCNMLSSPDAKYILTQMASYEVSATIIEPPHIW